MRAGKADSIQFFTYAAIMASSLFIPNLIIDFGASEFEVGIIVSAYGFAIFLSSYLFGRFSDIHGRILFLRLGLFISAITFLLQIFAYDTKTLLIIRILTGFSIGIFPAALISHVHDSGRSLGKFSSYGSLGWAFGNFIAGVIASYNEIFILSSILFFISFLISLKFEVKQSSSQRVSIPFFPIRVIKKNFYLYISFFLRHTGALAAWAIFPLFLAELGANKFWIGLLYFINSAIQFFVMRYIDKFNHNILIMNGLMLSCVVFSLYTITSNFYEVIPIQILLAISWSSLYVGSLLCLTQNIEKSTSIGILNSVTSLSGIFGPIIGGVISEIFGFKGVMYFALFFSFIAFLIYFVKFRKKR